MSGSSPPPPLPVAVVSAGRALSAAAPGATPAAAVAVVTTPQELAAAVERGARDIEIRSHLDLTTLARPPSPAPLSSPHPLRNAPTHLMYVMAHTRSIRVRHHNHPSDPPLLFCDRKWLPAAGNCADPGPAAALTAGPPGLLPPPLPLKRTQCMLVVGDSVMQILNGTQWLDNVYFRLQRQRVDPALRVLELGWSAPRPLAEAEANVPAAVVYLTNVTVQGQPRGSAAVVVADRGSKLLAQDCIFSDLYGMGYPFHLSNEASIQFVNSAFQNVHVNSAVVEIASGGIVQFNHSTFRNIHTPNDTWVAAASDDGWTFFLFSGSLTVDQDQPDIDVPRRGRDSCSRQFLVEEDTLYDIAYGVLDYHYTDEVILPPEPFASLDDAWFVSKRAALPKHAEHDSSEPPAAAPLPLPGPITLEPPCPPAEAAAVKLVAPLRFPEARPDRASGGRTDVVPIVALVLVAVLLLGAVALALFCIKRKSYQRPSSARGRSAKKVKHSSQRDLDRDRGAYLSLSNGLQAPPQVSDGMSVRSSLIVKLAALSANARPAHPVRSTQHAAYFDVRARYGYQLPPGPALRAALRELQQGGGLPRRGSAWGKPPAATGASAAPAQPHDVSLQLDNTAMSGGSARCTQRACTPRTAAAPPGPAPAPDSDGAPQESVTQQAQEGMRAVSSEPDALLPVLRAAAATAPSGGHDHSQPAARCWGVADYNLQSGTPELHRAARSMRSMRSMGARDTSEFASSQFDPSQYAIKFYLNRDEFEAEAALLATTAPAPPTPPARPESLASVDSVASTMSVVPGTRQESATLAAAPSHTGTARRRLPFLPDVRGAYGNTAEGVCDPRGRPLPPCIVMQRGESLQDWLGRCTPGWHSACTVLLAVSQCMADMHAAGFVHRGLKPSNIMWLPRANRWHVTGFGRSVATGQAAAADTTLAYCAPELLHAHFEGTALAAAPAQDAWACGIVAWELLTGSPAFDLIDRGPMEVLRAITGNAPLPWEGRGAEMITRQRQLGILQQPVLGLLRREPEGRATIQHFHAACAEATL
eukprot:jgi/Ulvmu1/5883/UM026_0003.1